MRNVIIASCLLAAAASVLVYQRSALANTRQLLKDLARQHAELETTISEARASVERIEGQGTARKRDCAEAAERLKQARAAQTPLTQMPNPAQEGHWPATRPYFYLAKKHIPAIDFQVFSWITGVSEEASAVF